jgi:hypothetical protein
MLFARMPERIDWLEKLSVVLQSRRLQASDYAALTALVEHFGRDTSDPDRHRFVTILDGLIERYPSKASLFIFKYQLLASGGDVSHEHLLQILEHAVQINPRDLKIYPYQIIEYEKVANWAAMHEAARGWMREDTSRRQLPSIRRVFGQQ